MRLLPLIPTPTNWLVSNSWCDRDVTVAYPVNLLPFFLSADPPRQKRVKNVETQIATSRRHSVTEEGKVDLTASTHEQNFARDDRIRTANSRYIATGNLECLWTRCQSEEGSPLSMSYCSSLIGIDALRASSIM